MINSQALYQLSYEAIYKLNIPGLAAFPILSLTNIAEEKSRPLLGIAHGDARTVLMSLALGVIKPNGDSTETRTPISSLRGLLPVQLEDGTIKQLIYKS